MRKHLPTRIYRLKILKHILSGLIWSLLVLYGVAIASFHLPYVQTKLGTEVAHLIGDELKTEVHIGNVNLGYLNRFIIDDVVIFDQQHGEMLRVGRLSTKVELLPLLEGRISISSIQLFGAHVKLTRPDEKSPANFQFVIDALASSDTTSHTPLDLHINSIIIRHSSASYDQMDAKQQARFDTKHLRFSDISAHIILKELTDDSLNINVKRLAMKEQSGLNINHLAFKYEMGDKDAHLSDLTLTLPHSTLSVDHLSATYESRKRLIETVAYKLNSIEAHFTISDMSFLQPTLSSYNHTISLATSAEGTGTSIRIPELNISASENAFQLKAYGWATNLDQHYPAWQIFLDKASLSADGLRMIQNELNGVPAFVGNLGKIDINGHFDGTTEGVASAHSFIMTDVSKLKVDLIKYKEESWNGEIHATNVNMEQLLPEQSLGTLTANLSFTGSKSRIYFKGDIPQLEYKNYSYRNIAVNGSYNTADIFGGNHYTAKGNGKIQIDDANLKASIATNWSKAGRKIDAQIEGAVNHIKPKELHLSDKWGDAVFSGSFLSDLRGSNLNDAEGTIEMRQFAISDSTDTYTIDHLKITSGFDAKGRILHIDGDMGKAELTGKFNWDTLPQSFINYIASQLPTLPGLPPTNKSVTNDFALNMVLSDSEWMQRIVGIPFRLNAPMTLNATINDLTHNFHVDGRMPSFTYDGESYKDAIIQLDTPGDTIKCDLSLKKTMGDHSEMDLALLANAYDNQLQSCLTWDNSSAVQPTKGELNAITQLYSDEKGLPEAHIHIQPSHATLGVAKWNIIPCDIFYSDKNLTVENFSIEHNQQHLSINGVASEQSTDTLRVDMKDIDVSYVLNLVDFHAVEFNGLATGHAYATNLFNVPKAQADLMVKKFTFEGGRMGTLQAHAQWNNEEEQIDIHAIADDGNDAITRINGYVSPVGEDIMLDIKGEGTYIDFVYNYTNSFLDNVTGHAYGDLKLVGPLGEMDLLGSLVIDGHATVKPLGTTYTLQHDTIKFIRNDIRINRAQINDYDGNSAFITGGIHHDHLSKLTFDLDIEAEQFLSYDFPDFGNEIFCGKVYASGTVDLHGRPGEVVINCNATPLRPTVFFYNASSNDAVSNQEFITWREKQDSLSGPLGNNTAYVTRQQDDDIPTDIYINFLINTTPQATLRLLMDQKTGDYITLNGSGVMRASYHNKGAFMLYGTYLVDHGTYGITIQNIIKKNFQFKEGGTIVFGGNPMNAALQLQASHTVNGVSLSDLNIGNSFTNNTIRVNCLMNIQGQAGAPRVEFDLDMPTVNSEEKQMIRSIISSEQEMNQQVLYLLGVGRFYTQGINNAEANNQEYGQTELAMQSFLSGTLSSQINDVISHVIKNDNWNFGANISTGTEGWHNAEYEGLVSGSLFNNRLLINGQFGYRDNARQATPSFIGDFDIRYLLQPNGNLALKVYNQTNDRYFTKSSLNTQGVGIILKRDFNNIGDLLFKNWKNHHK